MEHDVDIFSFYIITENDDYGETAHGPYTMKKAEQIVQVDEEIITGKRLASIFEQASTPNANSNTKANIENTSSHSAMVGQIRRWGMILLFLGVIQLVSGGFLSNTWGILLIIVGLSSFYFGSAAMYIIYGATLGWAAISNALGSSGGWVAFSVLQIYFSFQTFRTFFKVRSTLIHSNNESPFSQADKAAKPFPWISLVSGLFSIVGIIIVFLSVIVLIDTGNEGFFDIVDFSEGIVIDLALIGFSTGLASLLSGYKFKLASIIGMIAGVLVLLLEIVIALI